MKIELSDQQLQVIDQALQQLPYNVAAPLLDHINQQKMKRAGMVTLEVQRPLSWVGDASEKWQRNHLNCGSMIINSDERLMKNINLTSEMEKQLMTCKAQGKRMGYATC
ncbi:hypothetical protein [Leclercia adecarboxylata]|uniref:hypothetical protein n=1 Tax=Leclercia adecarboxylata TaxID=83655 RepID=UPI0013DF9638|nr:hypothetical protein [Leclercia adecarboxylata]QIG28453.1 hypothetical protein FY044_09335 [Leclercia adecarboxylata]